MLSEDIYRRAFRVSSLFYNARRTQIEMGCDGSKCIVIPNGVQYQRFCDIPLKPEDGWVDIGAVVRLAPIKDIKTMSFPPGFRRFACTSWAAWTMRTMRRSVMPW